MWLFGKPPSEIVEADLRALIANGVREGVSLEFKRDMYARRDPTARLEMLRDISSIANAEGGVLIVGIEEDGQGVAATIVPVPDAETEAGRIVASSLTGISERIPGLTATPVPVQGGAAILVSVPRSYRRPHMVVADGFNELWIRHDRQKSRMSIAEVRSAISTTEDLVVKAETFLQVRRNTDLRLAGAVLAVTGTPLSLEDGRVDPVDRQLREVLTHPPSLRPQHAGAISLGDDRDEVEPTIRGVRTIFRDQQYLEVFRNGHVEFVIVNQDRITEQPRQGGRVIRGWAVAEVVRNFLHFLVTLRAETGINDPYLVGIWLYNCLGVGLPQRFIGRFGQGRVNQWNESNDLFVGPLLTHLDAPDPAAKQLADLFWNAFHFAGSPFFGAEGTLTIPDD